MRYRRVWLALGWLMIGAVVWLSLIPSPPEVMSFTYGDKVGHLLAYGVLMGWFGQLYRRPLMRLSYGFSFVLLGVVLEFTQALGGYRWFEVADAVANGVGVVVALLILNRGADRILHWFEGRVMGLRPRNSEPSESP